MTTALFPRARRGELLVVGLCFAAIVCEGYDLIVYGAVVPELLHYEPWHLTPTEAGAIGSYGLFGMLVGALCAGAVADVLGRRRTVLISVAWFSLAMAACALAPSPGWFGLFRALGGLGLGGVMPTAIALTVECSAPHRRSLNNALMFSGYSVGGILAAVLAMPLLPRYGFRVMFWIGVLPLVLVVPLLWRYLPESAAFLRAEGRPAEAEEGARRFTAGRAAPTAPAAGRASARAVTLALFSPRHLRATLLFALTSFFGLLLVYGLNTWLPEIMKGAGYPLSGSLLFLVAMNAGAVAGSTLLAPLGDRIGMKPVTALSFGAAAVSIALLSRATYAPALYLLVAVAGCGTIGTQILVNAYVALHYPPQIRATALGWALGIGRFGAVAGPAVGGLLVAADVGAAVNFYAFAVPAVLGAGSVLLLPGRRRTPAAAPAAPSSEPVKAAA
ncbi:MFS transporter [Streptomyces sp. NPDC093984]|uniref:MFS transporter n=1 Tax=Streptomyces sp. NPDC093984 TaxID=3366052 RepID=UPI0037F4E32C